MSTPAVTRPGRTRARGGRSRKGWFALFVAPFFVGLLLFVYVPIIWSTVLSFAEARNTVTPTRWVGLANYSYLLHDQMFLRSLLVFGGFALFIVPLTFASSLGLAMLLNSTRRGQALFRSVFFIPTAVSYVIASMVWRMSFFNGARFGLANAIVRALGGSNVQWLGGTNYWYWFVLVTLRLWLQSGYYMVLFIAGLNRIPPETYEAAELDGASGWRMFRHMTFPQLRTTSVAVQMLLLIGAFQAFDEFWNVLASNGTYPPYGRPPLVYLYLVSLGGQEQDLGIGGAGTVIITAIIVVFGVLQNWLSTRGDKES